MELRLAIKLPKLGLAKAPDPVSLAATFSCGVYSTSVMFFATEKHNRGLQVVFISLAVLFFLLTAGQLTGNSTITLVAGYEGIFTGLAAVYVGLAFVINETYKRDVLLV